MQGKYNVWVLLVVCVGLAIAYTSQLGLESSVEAADVAELKDQLEDGLRARQPRELRFIATVVVMVERGRLPLPIVVSSYRWAREKAGRSKHPFPYFERALRILAARIGVEIPNGEV